MRKVFCLLVVLAAALAPAPAAEAGGYGRGVTFLRTRAVAFVAAPAYAAVQPVLAVQDDCHAAALAAPVVGYSAAPVLAINAGYGHRAAVFAVRGGYGRGVQAIRVRPARAIRGY